MGDKNVIRINYAIHPGEGEEINSIEFDNRLDFSLDTFKPKDRLLDKLDRALLETRPSLARLSIGMFKLKSDFADYITDESTGKQMKFGIHTLTYERIRGDYNKNE